MKSTKLQNVEPSLSSEFTPQLNPYMTGKELKKAQEATKVFEDCSCVEEAWLMSNDSGLSDKWIKNDHLAGWDYPSSDTVAVARAKLEGRLLKTPSF